LLRNGEGKDEDYDVIIEVRNSKTTSSHGMVRPMSWLKPNSSSALWRRLWNCGWPNHEIGTIYLVLFSPTYTAKCPFGTSSGRPSSSYPCFFPKLEHLLTICFITSAWGSLLDFLMAILLCSFCYLLSKFDSLWKCGEERHLSLDIGECGEEKLRKRNRVTWVWGHVPDHTQIAPTCLSQFKPWKENIHIFPNKIYTNVECNKYSNL